MVLLIDIVFNDGALNSAAAESNVGVGGSLARFQIVEKLFIHCRKLRNVNF